jgi:hypothetical protein
MNRMNRLKGLKRKSKREGALSRERGGGGRMKRLKEPNHNSNGKN